MSVTVVVLDPAFEADAALGGPIDILVDNTAGWPLSTGTAEAVRDSACSWRDMHILCV